MKSTTKVCKDCGLEKPLEDFYRCSRNEDGRQIYCRPCHGARNRLNHQGRGTSGPIQLPMGGMKTCTRCEGAKPLSGFYRDRRSDDGRKAWCKDCHKAYNTAYVARRRASPSPLRLDVAAIRLWSYIEQRGPDECWPWTGPVHKGSQIKTGELMVNGRHLTVRRLLFLVLGDPVPDDMVVKPRCGSAVCMNPSHLQKRTRDNVLEDGTKICSRCREVKQRDAFGSNPSSRSGLARYCKSCVREVARDRTYGFQPGEYDALLAAHAGVCALCGMTNGKKALAIDHDHQTGLVRGLLCDPCNVGIGMLRHDPALMLRAVSYLQRATESSGAA